MYSPFTRDHNLPPKSKWNLKKKKNHIEVLIDVRETIIHKQFMRNNDGVGSIHINLANILKSVKIAQTGLL